MSTLHVTQLSIILSLVHMRSGRICNSRGSLAMKASPGACQELAMRRWSTGEGAASQEPARFRADIGFHIGTI